MATYSDIVVNVATAEGTGAGATVYTVPAGRRAELTFSGNGNFSFNSGVSITNNTSTQLIYMDENDTIEVDSGPYYICANEYTK